MFKSHRKKIYLGCSLLLLGIIFDIYLYSDGRYFIDNPKKATFTKLENLRNEKKTKIINYLEYQKQSGIKFAQDNNTITYFKELYYLYKNNQIKSDKYRHIDTLINKLFTLKLNKFYDLLFIDNDGNIFFTMLKESDYLGNIFDSKFDGLSLYEDLRKRKYTSVKFVDFEYYSVSGKPASFFITPVIDNHHNKIIGSIVLQLPINQVNAIFTDTTGLGRSGEVYLVNNKHLMITQSRFINDNTILNKMIDTEAVKNTLKEKRGNKIIEDYRHKKVFSSYEQFDYDGIKWIIIAEIEEDEIITDLYLLNEKQLFNNISEYIANYQCQSNIKNNEPLFTKLRMKPKSIKVGFKEYQKSTHGELLYTLGVSTCTAVSICYPDKFGFLIHITPTDVVYENDGLIKKILFKDFCTNFVDNVLSNIEKHDIKLSEKPKLHFGIFSTQTVSTKNIIHKLINHGIELSQIKFVYKKDYEVVNIVFDYEKDLIWSQWGTDNINRDSIADYKNVPDLGEITKIVSGYSRKFNDT